MPTKLSYATVAKLNKAKHGTQTHRKNGRSERFVMLWDSKDYSKAKFVGRVDPKTMERVTELGLWERDMSPFTDQSDTANEHWWKVE